MKKRALALLCALALAGTSPNLLPALSAQAAQADEAGNAGGTTYYISSIHGDNAKAGTSESAAWETLDKLKKLKLKPGDRVLLEKGSVFEDAHIHLRDVHGTADAPIRIGSYGTGTAKPAIHANGQGIWYQNYAGALDNSKHRSKGYVSSAILLYDVDFVEISDLELTNESNDFEYFKGAVVSVKEASANSGQFPDTSDESDRNMRMDRTGVAGFAKNGGTMEHVYLDNLYIHDVDGNIGDKHMDNGGIQMNAGQPDNEEVTGIARYHDVRITNCYVKDVHRAGICVGYTYRQGKFGTLEISDEAAQKYGHTDLVMENNYVQDIGNDGIVAMYAYRPLVQHNVADRCGMDLRPNKDGGYGGETGGDINSYYGAVCAGIWPWKCKDGIFQYNEGFDLIDNQDGMPWDIDWSDGTVYQYNYSHNNGGGCIMFCGINAYQGVFRYNISQNDLKGLLVLVDNNPKGEIYNNVFYIGGDLSTKIHKPNVHRGVGVMSNNIFYNVSQTVESEGSMDAASDTWSNNIFYGYDDRFDLASLKGENNISADPKFVDPGKGPASVLKDSGGMAAIHDTSAYDGYKLKSDSPAINAGVFVEGMPDVDFFGNKVGLIPDIGAYESDAAETDHPIGLQAFGKTSMSFGDDKIEGVPYRMTAGELKKKLVCTKGDTLAIVSGVGNGEVSEDAIVDETMKVIVTRGEGETKEYRIATAKTYHEYAVADIQVTAGSEEKRDDDSSGDARRALDGKLNTMWHTSWGGCGQEDVWIQFDLGEPKDVAMVKYVARPYNANNTSHINGIFTKYKVEVSLDGQNWDKVDEGTWSGEPGETEYSKFGTARARYVKLYGLETRSDNENKIYGTAAEVRIGCEAPEE